jgi:hypothetical protein
MSLLEAAMAYTKTVFWCPLDGFVYVMLLKCGWREVSRVWVDMHFEAKLEAPNG